MTAEQKRPGISIDPDIHKKTKIRATELGVSIKTAVDSALEHWLSHTAKTAKKLAK